MSERVLDLLIRLAGSEGARVRLLRQWLDRTVRGQLALEQERRMGPGSAVDMTVVRLFIGLMAVFYSIGVGVTLVFVDAVLTPWIVAGLHNLVMAVLLAAIGLRTWLGEDDTRIIGWWPVSIRDAMLARTGMLVDPLVRLTLACSTIPLLVLAVVGDPPVISAVLLAIGILLQTIGHLVAGLAMAVGLQLRLGGQRARRWFPLVYLSAVLGPWALLFTLPDDPAGGMASALRQTPWALLLGPPGWISSWGTLFVSPRAWIGVLAGLVVAACSVPWVLRVLLPRGRGETIEPARARPGRFPFVRVAETLLWPFAPGREGWIVRRLTAAHLRDDPYAAGSFAVAPVLLLVELTSMLLDPQILAGLSGGWRTLPVRTSVLFPFLALILPLATLPQLVYSTHARASWCIAVGELDPARVFAAQRGIARALVLAPMLLGFAVLHLRAGTVASLVIADLVYAWLLWELSCAGIQQLYPVLPFSRPRQGGGQELIPVAVLINPAGILLAVWGASVYELFWIGRGATWVTLALIVRSLHRRLARGAGGRLRTEIAGRP